MSAIWGTVQKTTSQLEPAFFQMKNTYDDSCILDRINEYQNKNLLFGCGIQYITRESRCECLPIHSTDNQLLFTADCLLDNRDDLMKELHITDSNTPDGTLLYHAYLKWGKNCVHHLHGIYSIAAYDIASDMLFLTTDPTASRCLYYYPHKGGCTFSTLLAPILNVHNEIKKNELYLEDFLIAPGLRPNLSATETPYEGVYKLEAGTYVTISGSKKEVHRYWSPKTLPLHIKTATQCKDQFLSIFLKCVQRTLRTDGEVGLALSSGFDSSAVAALAAKELQKASKSLYSYTYVPYHEGVCDVKMDHFVINEKESIQKTLAMYPNIKPHFLNTNGKDFYQSLDEMLAIIEIPFKAFVNLPSLQELYQSATKDQCKVFLTGQYGNATISYGDIDNVLYDMYSKHHYVSYLRTLNQYCKKAKESRKMALRGCNQYFRHTDAVYRNPTPISEEFVSNPYLNKELIHAYPYKERFANEKLPIMDRAALSKEKYESYLYFTSALTYIGEFETKFGLANGIVLRDPTRDPDIISFCHTIPYKFFAYKGTPRWLIREGMKEYLPKEIIAPFLRYGVQNPDWAYRVALNWNTIYTSLHQHLTSSVLANYVDSSKIHTFLNKTKEDFAEDDYENSLNIFFLDILYRFLI